jgi:DNA uptake protein ComE-like DNA-binding protein
MKYVYWLVKDYFGFSRTESRGLFFMLALVLLAIGGNWYYDYHTVQHYALLQSDREVLAQLLTEIEQKQLPAEVVNVEADAPVIKRELFFFDPNTADQKSLQRLGINEKMAQRIINYRSKGGSFRKAEDLLRIYGFPEALYADLRPYIQIAQVNHEKKAKKNSRASVLTPFPEEATAREQKEAVLPKLSLDINHVDSLSLQQLQGIGPVLSSRIIRYRDQLGGIYDVAQLSEVYHISEQAMTALAESAYVDESFEPQKININAADFKMLLSHPYIDYELARAIMNHRRIYGNFTSPDQLREVYQIKEELLVKLLPYLVI